MSKAQIWTIDLMGGVTIFLIVVVSFFVFTSNIADQNRSNVGEIYEDISVVSDSLLSEGSPSNWTIDNIKEVGITDGDHRLNTTKLQNIDSLSYSGLKSLLKTKYDYMVFFENKSNDILNINGVDYISKPGLTKDNIKGMEDPDDLVSIKRFLIYDSEIIMMVVYLWQ